MTKDQLTKIITEVLGERCPEHHEQCMTCAAWWMFDRLSDEPEAPHLADIPGHPEVRLTEMTFKAKEDEPFEATAQYQGDAVKEWALAMVQWFREKGGINYVACDLRDPATGEAYEITMQKAGGRTPAQDLAELRAQVQPVPCSCTTYCMHSGYPDTPIKRGVYCKEARATENRK